MSSNVDVLGALGSNMSGIHRSSASISGGSSIFSSTGPGRRLASLQSHMEIRLDNHFRSKVYSAGDTIAGTVTIVPQRNIAFDQFEIVLLGITTTRVDTISSPGESSHVFLKLFMPVDDAAYPVPRVLEAQTTYTLPVHFVVPRQLTLGACNHPVDSPAIHARHTMLPPSMGRATNSRPNTASSASSTSSASSAGGSSSGSRAGMSAAWERDDMAPEMARVEYMIKARVLGEAVRTDKSGITRPMRVKIVEAVHPLRILPPSLIDAVPPTLTPRDRNYSLRASKTLRKGLFSLSKLGIVTALVGDGGRPDGRICGVDIGTGPPLPAPIIIQPDGLTAELTTAAVQLTFDPFRADVLPPHITHVSAKLTASTYFSRSGIASLPDHGDWVRTDNMSTDRRGVYSTSVSLLSQPVHGFHWEAQVNTGRRDSGYCSDDATDGTDCGGCGNAHARASSGGGAVARRRSSSAAQAVLPGLSYAAQLLLPIALPMHKRTFLPTFHSCIVSRTYTLNLNITVAPDSTSSSLSSSSSSSSLSSSSSSSTTLSLALPVQIAVAGRDDALTPDSALPSFEEAEADSHLDPRVMAIPDVQYQETSLLPGYRR